MDKTALLIIDAQQEYFAPLGKVVLPDGPKAVARIAATLRWARANQMPVFHIVHESRRPDAATFVPGSPLDGSSVLAPAVTVNQDTAGAPQNETAIAVDPNNAKRVVASANDYASRTITNRAKRD